MEKVVVMVGVDVCVFVVEGVGVTVGLASNTVKVGPDNDTWPRVSITCTVQFPGAADNKLISHVNETLSAT